MKWNVVLLLVSSGVAHGQALPNDVDLKAAYCTRMVSLNLTALAATEKVLPSGRADLQKALDEEVESLQATHKRLRAYLFPRMLQLDSASLVAASNQASSDMDSASRSFDKCPANALAFCQTAAIDLVEQKSKSCRDTSWLPF